MNRKVALLSFLIALAYTAIGQPSNHIFDQILKDRFGHEAFGINALVSKGGEIVYNHSSGMADAIEGMRMSNDRVFRIGSITKQFTATSILQLVAKGLVELEDPISSYLGDLPYEIASITVEQLLTHTSGMGSQNDIEGWREKMSHLAAHHSIRDSIRQIYMKAPLAFQPGIDYKYSNFGYFILGDIIEIVSGLTYAHYLEEYIFDPLGMDQTSYENNSNLPTVSGHSIRNSEVIIAEDLNMRIPFSGGGLISTVKDLFTWNQAITHGKVIGLELLSKAHAAHTLPSGKSVPYGFGWQIGKINQERTIKHDGIINGFTSMALYLPNQDIFVVLLSNCDCSRDIELTASHLAAALLESGEEKEELRDVILSEEYLVGLSGVYSDSEGDERYLTFQDGVLKYHSKGGRKESLVALDSFNFAFTSSSLTKVQFTQNEDGQITSLLFQDLGLGETYRRTKKDAIVLNAIMMTDLQIDVFVGEYEFPQGFTLELLREGKQFFGQVQGHRKDVRPSAINKFYALEDDIRLEFEEVDGEMILTMMQGMEMKAKRIAN